ncbi:hypothetical protein Tco_0247612 [Tanacetum coccineum]
MTSSNLNVMEIRRRNIIKAFLESHRYEACETKDQRMQSQVKEDHKVIQRSKLKQVKDQDQVITSTSEDHESRFSILYYPRSGSLPVSALSDMEDDVDISALTMELYIALIPDDIKPGIVNPKIGDDIEFEINANFMRELRCKIFAGTNDEDAYKHVRTILEIVNLFHFPSVTHDSIMLKEKAYQLTHKVLTNTGEKVKAIMIMGEMKEPVPRNLPPTPFLRHLKEQMAQDDEEDMDVSWDITSKDIKRHRQFLTPTIHTLPNLEPVVQTYIPLRPVHDMDNVVKEKQYDYDIPLNNNVMQPLTPQTVHIIPSGDDYVAPATNPMSNKQVNKFEDEFSNITKVTKREYDNPETYDCEKFIQKLLHQDPAARRHLSRSARLIIMCELGDKELAGRRK